MKPTTTTTEIVIDATHDINHLGHVKCQNTSDCVIKVALCFYNETFMHVKNYLIYFIGPILTISISFSLYMCLFFLFILKSKLCTLYFPSTLTDFNNFDFVVVKHVHLLFDNTSLLQDESKTKSFVTKYIKNGTSCVKIVFFV